MYLVNFNNLCVNFYVFWDGEFIFSDVSSFIMGKVAYKYSLIFIKKLTLENVAINEVLPLNAHQRCAIANANAFGASGHQRPNFDGCIYIRYAAPPYWARIRAIYLLSFCKVWLHSVCQRLCAMPGNEAEHRIEGGCVKTPVPFQPVCGP